MPRTRQFARRPAFDVLEGRELLSATKNVPTSFLLTPIPESAVLAEHIHPFLTIITEGKRLEIPGGIGLKANGNLPIHTHDSSGILHIESTQKLPFRLRDFFTIWGQPFSKNNMLGFKVDKTHKLTMMVNAKPSMAFGSLLLKDFQDIVIRYVAVKHR